ncbi:ATP-binding protein [Spirosoma luteolum]
MTTPLPPPTLTDCDQEPIQWPGFIQSYGYLLVLEPTTLVVQQVSENILQLTQEPLEALLGRHVGTLQLGDLPGTRLAELLGVMMQADRLDTFAPYPILINGQKGYLLLHQHDEALILEWEPMVTAAAGLSVPQDTLLHQTMSDIQRSESLQQLLDRIVERVKQLTGFDRIMIYRFADDWSGEVVSEARSERLESWLGMHYPASDIPRQARQLYKINLVRGIVDVQASRVAILPVNHARHNRPLDLTYANLRAVSPLHIEYLQNMGVRSSMSISLLSRGELWGLIACHHYSAPRFVDFKTRESLKLISQLLSTTIELRQSDEDKAYGEQLFQHEELVYKQMQADWDVVQGLTKHQVTVLDLNSATGAALLFEGQLSLIGQTPPAADIHSLIDWLRHTTTEKFFQTNQLPLLYPAAERFSDTASGLLMVMLSREMNEYLLWFKAEQIKSVTWGGNPEKAITQSETGAMRLSPRKSFEKWTEEVRFKAQPWRQVEVAAVLKLREDLLQLVSQKANQIRVLSEQLRQAYEELEAFSYTVSHDLRTPLSSIRSYTEIYLEDYASQMDEPARRTLSKVVRATNRMSALIQNIMDYSRTGRSDLTLAPLSMGPLLAQLRDEVLSVETSDRHIDIVVGETPDLEGDLTMVTQVFSNLLSNAVKYTRDTPQALVTVQGRLDRNEVIYSVTDNGIGIDMKQAGKVFELFQRLDSATRFDGYGVGLAIVKRIMSRHKGKIWFESIPQRSTTFYVSFPTVTLPA